MIKKTILAIVACVLAIVAIIAFAPRKTAAPPKTDTVPTGAQVKEKNSNSAANQNAGQQETKDAPEPTKTSPGEYSGEDAIMAEGVSIEEITYDGKNFEPAALNIKLGDVVIFRNKSTASFWPAAAPHPQHSSYPEFDPKKPIPAGQIFEFKFAKAGTWKYHDHLSPQAAGTIIVAK